MIVSEQGDVNSKCLILISWLPWRVVTLLTYLLICFLWDAGGGSLCFPEVWLWPRRVPRRRIIVTLSLFRPFRVMYCLDMETRHKPSHWLTWMSSTSDWFYAGFLLSSPRLKSEPNIGTLAFLARFTEANVLIWPTMDHHHWDSLKWSGDTCPNTDFLKKYFKCSFRL